VQAPVAEKLVASEPCAFAPSALTEFELLLRGAYALDAPTIDASLCDLLALEISAQQTLSLQSHFALPSESPRHIKTQSNTNTNTRLCFPALSIAFLSCPDLPPVKRP